MLKLTIIEIERDTERVMFTSILYYSDIKDCLKSIHDLDKVFEKEFYKFKYIIEENSIRHHAPIN